MLRIKCGPVPGVERPDALLLADPEESVEHPSVAHLCVLGLTLDLQACLRQVDGERPCGQTSAVREIPDLLTGTADTNTHIQAYIDISASKRFVVLNASLARNG